MTDTLPATGGSYTRDPETGVLDRTAGTARADDTPKPGKAPKRTGSKKKED